QALLNESVGAGYLERNWPPALKESGAWPLASLRQSFLNGSLTRLLDPDSTLRGKIVEFVNRGDFGLASGQKPDGSYERVWLGELIAPEEVAFEAGVFLLTKAKAQALKSGGVTTFHHRGTECTEKKPEADALCSLCLRGESSGTDQEPTPGAKAKTYRIVGNVTPEVWNRLGTKILPKLRAGKDLQIGIDFSVTVGGDAAKTFESEIRQILDDLGLTGKVRLE
ncbi:MAG: AAA family ATPase, partial [Planctomycetota bacterium]|nr:AAA family ATPase [Planctomycetota bacterium]